jgi:hypothetical protein
VLLLELAFKLVNGICPFLSALATKNMASLRVKGGGAKRRSRGGIACKSGQKKKA